MIKNVNNKMQKSEAIKIKYIQDCKEQNIRPLSPEGRKLLNLGLLQARNGVTTPGPDIEADAQEFKHGK